MTRQKLRSDDMDQGGPWVNMASQGSTEPHCVTSPINPSSGGHLFSRSVKATMDGHNANARLPGTASPGGTLKPLGSYKEGVLAGGVL
ncbi:hypothetical protein DUNSADRAFT_4241 [Dunaliella salina]|uniref:Encoded protein n=1 Tax=Dunaliella salina TaxID=3046 RepID=A0ABQ7FUW0_DUNSA|nr:hypothetical protein DUNSADRAFT_4241 [Dunaliella salina]|eukprot:KAF5826192.1 hypothetical protein DUNSADRAFT_4241 [Dunaliella salina]